MTWNSARDWWRAAAFCNEMTNSKVCVAFRMHALSSQSSTPECSRGAQFIRISALQTFIASHDDERLCDAQANTSRVWQSAHTLCARFYLKCVNMSAVVTRRICITQRSNNMQPACSRHVMHICMMWWEFITLFEVQLRTPTQYISPLELPRTYYPDRQQGNYAVTWKAQRTDENGEETLYEMPVNTVPQTMRFILSQINYLCKFASLVLLCTAWCCNIMHKIRFPSPSKDTANIGMILLSQVNANTPEIPHPAWTIFEIHLRQCVSPTLCFESCSETTLTMCDVKIITQTRRQFEWAENSAHTS